MRDVRDYLASSLIGAFSPQTRPGNPSKCEFVMHFDEFLVQSGNSSLKTRRLRRISGRVNLDEFLV